MKQVQLFPLITLALMDTPGNFRIDFGAGNLFKYF